MQLFTHRTLVLFLIVGTILCLTSWVEDPPNYHTGAPGELTCASCHTPPSANASTGLIEILGLPDTLSPNTDYRIKVRITKTFGDAAQAGFQMTLINERKEKIGTFSNPSNNSAVTIQPYRDYFEHRPAATFQQDSVVEWEVTWTSPNEDEAFSQTLHLYASGLLGNADSSYTGDVSLNTFESVRYISNYTRLSGNISSSNVSCSGNHDGTATAQYNGGRPPYKYNWNTGDSTQTVTNLAAGTYSLTITDSAIDTLEDIVTITQPFPVFGKIIKTDIPCNTSIAAEAIVLPTTGIAPFTYLWSNGATTDTTSFTHSGIISVVITDSTGCQYTAVSSIIKKGEFSANISDISNVKCYGDSTGSATVTTTIPFPTSFTWSNGASTPTATNLSAGIYSVTVTDVDGCEARATGEVRQPTPIEIKSNQINQPSCIGSFNGLISVFADGGVPPYSFLWQDGSTLKTITGLVAGNYNITVTDAFGCTSDKTFTLNEPELFTAVIDHLNESGENANNGKALILPSGGAPPYTFTWSDGVNTRDRDQMKPGYYNVTITDIKGCSLLKDVYIAPYNCDIVIQDVILHHVDCNGSATGFVSPLVQGGIPPLSYLWSDGSGASELRNVKSGYYTLTIKDSLGCTTNGFFKINQPPPFKRTMTVTDASSAEIPDGKVKFVFSGGTPPYQLVLDAGDTITSYTGIITLDDQANGLHNYITTDAHGCVISELFVINLIGCALSPTNVVIQDVKCYGGSDAAICIKIKNATGPYELFWDDESSELCRFDLTAGQYNLHVSDSLGCQSLDTFTIRQPSIIRQIDIITVLPEKNQNNGSISVINTGGIPDYIYSWYKDGIKISGSTSLISGLSAGSYSYTLKDANDCLYTSDSILLENNTSSTYRSIKDLKLYPNPTNALLHIEWNTNIHGKGTIYNALGQVVRSEIAVEGNSVNLELSELPNGVYHIIITTNSGRYGSKFIKIE
jgi:hypothetical protein